MLGVVPREGLGTPDHQQAIVVGENLIERPNEDFRA